MGSRPEPIKVFSHRARGIGSNDENNPENALLALAEFDGVEVDIRGDGPDQYSLGHFRPNEHTLEELLILTKNNWQSEFVGKYLLLDIANDSGQHVSDSLIDDLIEMIGNSNLNQLKYIILASVENILVRCQTRYRGLESLASIEFAMTYFSVTSFTPPDQANFVLTNVSELPDNLLPKPVILFGVESRQTFMQSRANNNEVFGLVSDHPRRMVNLQK